MTYVDPAAPEWPTVSLVDGLVAKPTTETKSQLEDQTTVVLTWLLDRSAAFARAFVTRAFGDDREALEALGSATLIRARTWRALPKLSCSPGAGVMRPDLAIAGDNRTFELIVENKVGASLHPYECTNGCHPPFISQQEAYALAWAGCPEADEAIVRRVSVLTRDPFDRGVDVAPLRGRDLLWKDVRELLSADVENGVDDGVRAVALEFRDVLDERVLAQPEHALVGASSVDQERHPLLYWGADLLEQLLPQLAAGLHGYQSGPRLNGQSLYAGGYVRFPAASGAQLSVWLCVTEDGRPYSVPGFGDGLWVIRDGSWPPSARDLLVGSGFVKRTDLAGYSSERLFRSTSDLDAGEAPASASATLADELVVLLQRAAASG
jgi:hypothetical protein